MTRGMVGIGAHARGTLRRGIVVTMMMAVSAGGMVVVAQRGGMFGASHDHLAIRYSSGPVSDPIALLNQRIEDGTVTLRSEGPSGYLRSTLDALHVLPQSQMLVFSPTSFQALRINAHNPRALYFNDTVHVGWVRGGDILEIAAQDPQQGVIFYTLDQRAAGKPQFKRNDACLACHLMPDTLKVPGLLAFSTSATDENGNGTFNAIDHRTPLADRWAGWYVTGSSGRAAHLGNIVGRARADDSERPALATVEGHFDTNGYLSPFSDIVALMVLEHQSHVTNLLTRVGWEARLAAYQQRSPAAPLAERNGRTGRPDAQLQEAVTEFVDYLLFVDESPLTDRVQGSSGFAEAFAEQGPRDQKGRSLRQFDLEHRLMRYPCSYMIYSNAFDSLSAEAKAAVYARLWHVLSGRETSSRYSSLSHADRQAVVEILRDTKADLPEYFGAVTR